MLSDFGDSSKGLQNMKTCEIFIKGAYPRSQNLNKRS